MTKKDCDTVSKPGVYLIGILFIPNPDKPKRIATKTPRHKEELFIIII